jgi:hypothetical protein
MSGSIPLLPPYACVAGTGTALSLRESKLILKSSFSYKSLGKTGKYFEYIDVQCSFSAKYCGRSREHIRKAN